MYWRRKCNDVCNLFFFVGVCVAYNAAESYALTVYLIIINIESFILPIVVSMLFLNECSKYWIPIWDSCGNESKHQFDFYSQVSYTLPFLVNLDVNLTAVTFNLFFDQSVTEFKLFSGLQSIPSVPNLQVCLCVYVCVFFEFVLQLQLSVVCVICDPLCYVL